MSSDLCGYKGVVSFWDPATNGFPVTTEISEYKDIKCCMIEGVVSLQQKSTEEVRLQRTDLGLVYL